MAQVGEAGLVQDECDLLCGLGEFAFFCHTGCVDPAYEFCFAFAGVEFWLVICCGQFHAAERLFERGAFAACTGKCPLFVHELGECGGVDGKVPLAGHQFCKVQGESVGVVHLEGVLAAD